MRKRHRNRKSYPCAVPAMFLLVGVLLIVIGSIGLRKVIAFTETTATIDSITTSKSGKNTSHSVTVSYTVNGKTYKEPLGQYQRDFREGKHIDIYYNPDYPQEIYYPDVSGTVVLFVFGGIFLLISLLGFILYFRKQQRPNDSQRQFDQSYPERQ